MINNFKKINKGGGFTLVETLVAISVFSFAVLGLMSVLSNGITDIGYAKKKTVAVYLAQEGVEYIRNMRDNYIFFGGNPGWNNFKAQLASCNAGSECGFSTTNPIVVNSCTSNPSVCKIYLNNGDYNTNSSGNDSGFSRKIWMEVIESSREVKIFSQVSWTQGSGTYKIILSENLFNWTE
ncbi:MAG: prepilin-type N-terminal cleavage/methylation domain-containing protein [Burkholderiales bacterium]|nr:prepilin-type N-terminal cleavage/methylation domain-containing protein [Burkholderiales bacterium]